MVEGVEREKWRRGGAWPLMVRVQVLNVLGRAAVLAQERGQAASDGGHGHHRPGHGGGAHQRRARARAGRGGGCHGGDSAVAGRHAGSGQNQPQPLNNPRRLCSSSPNA